MFENVTSRYDMSDASIEIIVMLLIAFLLGLLLGYFLWKRGSAASDVSNEGSTDNVVEETATADVVDTPKKVSDDWRPKTLSAPEGDAEDLKRISGVGPVLEKTLNELGIFHYKQVSALSSDNIAWLDDFIAFPGRIERENWVGQSKELMEGVSTDFAKRYDKS